MILSRMHSCVSPSLIVLFQLYYNVLLDWNVYTYNGFSVEIE